MAVEKLDLKAIWESGKTWSQWMELSTDAKLRGEMERIFASVAIPAETLAAIKNLKRSVHVLALAEDWCGDVRRNVPVLGRLCAENPEMLRLRCVDKESKPQLMVRYLTNAAEAIPIVVFFSDAFVEIGNWGPRPSVCKQIMARGKAAGKVDVARTKIGEFYAADNHQSTIREMMALVETASATEA
jgi:hypothetical protein